jgi:D-glycero-D-manno-heptose 1,7-bisphosphate phosphatase
MTVAGAGGVRGGGRPALFLDRDGTLNVDTGYVDRPDRVHLLPGAAAAVARARARGFLVVVISNQSGIGRGYFDAAALEAVNARLRELLAGDDPGAVLDALYVCPHAPPVPGQAPCDCRKPAPGLILRAAREHGIDLARSWMVGDKPDDVAAGRAAGTRTVLISKAGEPGGADLGARGLDEAVERIAREAAA